MAPQDKSRSGFAIFEILVRENADMLTAYLRSTLNDPGAIDDLFQETMIVAWRRIDDYDGSLPFGPWLRGIARRLVLAHFRKQSDAPVWCSDAVLEALDARFEAFARKEGDSFRRRAESLYECLQKLTDRLRGVIELAYGRGLSFVEVAHATGESEVTIRKRAQRARQMLHDCILREESA